jgi:uncharacterized membrane protein
MKLWAALYLAIWVVFLEFLLVMIPQGQPFLSYLHYGLGFVIAGIAYVNFAALRRTTVPGRVKRIAYATFYLAVAMIVLGLLVLFHVGTGWPILFGLTVWNLFLFLHVVNAFAIITQMAATAIAYDMWEEKEFLQETRPGEVPPVQTVARP